MSVRDFLLLSLMCLVWGLNFVVTKWVISGDPSGLGYGGAPPFFAASLRFALVAVALAPLLRTRPKNLLQVAGVGVLMGALHFSLIYVGVRFATSSTVAVAAQLVVPFATILSVVFLGERIGWRRGLGIVLALAGVALIAYRPDDFALTFGVAFVAGGAVSAAAGTVLMKRMEPVGPFTLQAWVGLISAGPLFALSLATETGQLAALGAGGWRLALAVAFIVGAVAIFGHATYYALLRRYDATLIAPLTLMAPVWGMVFGVMLMHDPLDWRLGAGAALALAGVGVIAARSGRRAAAIVAVRGDEP